MDATADNYNPDATLGTFASCEYSGEGIGCMDANADNYDADAVTDSGACEYSCPFNVDGVDMLDPDVMYSCYWYVWVYDGYDYTVDEMIGYGYDCTCVEDPISGCMNADATNYNPDAQEDDGSCEFDCAAVGLSDATSTSGGGLWTGEVSWSLVDADGNVVASGGAAAVATDATQNFCIDPDVCYTINMSDSYGDGWNGNILTINGEEFTLAAGSSGTASFGTCVFECDATELAISVDGTDEGSDFGFAITDADGGTVAMSGDDIGCFDLATGCYSVALSSAGGNGPLAGTLTIGDYSFDWGSSASSYTSSYAEAFGGGCAVYGCTDPQACNYNADADTDDGSCWTQDDCDADFCFTEDFDGIEDGSGLAASLSNFATWSGTDADDALVGAGQVYISSSVDVVTSLPAFTEGVFEVAFDMTVAEGGSGYFNFGNSGDVAAWDWEMETYFYADGTASTIGNAATWSYTAGESMSVSTFIDLDNGAAIMIIDGEWVSEWAWTGALGGVNFFGAAATTDSYTIDNFSMCISEMPVQAIAGCTDDSACNYDASATEDDGSCTYSDECNTCDGPIDSDGDGVADCDEVVGCTDSMACNYNPNATDEGDCEYTDGIYDCDGVTCLNDSDGDGVCDQNEIAGCTDSSATNYSNVATDDDGSCAYAVYGCTDNA
jgi:hypothetical protein